LSRLSSWRHSQNVRKTTALTQSANKPRRAGSSATVPHRINPTQSVQRKDWYLL